MMQFPDRGASMNDVNRSQSKGDARKHDESHDKKDVSRDEKV